MADPIALSFLSRAQRLDDADLLRPFREAFEIEEGGPIYLDGNSLGRMPRAAKAVLEQAATAWSDRLIRGWNEGWIEASHRIGEKLAQFLGAGADEVVVADSTSVNLYKLATAAVRRSGKPKIVTDALNFPSDLYVLQGVCRETGAELIVVPSEDGIVTSPEAIEAELDDRTALLALTHTSFKSGFVHDMSRLTSAAHAVGALALWDLSHSAGAVPVDLRSAGADLAVGCGYKYLNGGPGAPAFLFVRQELQSDLIQPIWGWLGHAEPFAFEPIYRPAQGIGQFVSGTPPILSLLPVECGVDLLLEAGMDRLVEKSRRQTEFLIEMADALLVPLGFRMASPRDPGQRGSHVALAHPEGLAIDLALIHEANVIPDFRAPDVVRFGIAPLYNTFMDIAEAMLRTREVVERDVHRRYRNHAVKVT